MRTWPAWSSRSCSGAVCSARNTPAPRCAVTWACPARSGQSPPSRAPLDDPDILALAAKVACPADNEADFPSHFSGEVIVHLIDGTLAQRKVQDSHGTSQDPMTDTEVLAKFHATAGRRIDLAQRDRIALLVADLDHVVDVSELIDACMAEASASVQGSD